MHWALFTIKCTFSCYIKHNNEIYFFRNKKFVFKKKNNIYPVHYLISNAHMFMTSFIASWALYGNAQKCQNFTNLSIHKLFSAKDH